VARPLKGVLTIVTRFVVSAATMATSLTFQTFQAVNSFKGAINDIENPPVNEDGSIKGEDTDEFHNKINPHVMDIVGVAGMTCSAATLFLTEGHIADAASFSTFALAPYAAYQKRQLKDLGGLRGQHNALRETVNGLTAQNNILDGSIDTLALQVNNLEGVEATLEQVAKDGKTSVTRLTEIIKRNGEIQAKIKTNLERQVIQDLVTIVVATDRDGDFSLNEFELNELVLRLHGRQGVEFHEANFRKLVKANCTLASIMKVIRNLMDDDVPEKDCVFHLNASEMIK